MQGFNSLVHWLFIAGKADDFRQSSPEEFTIFIVQSGNSMSSSRAERIPS